MKKRHTYVFETINQLRVQAREDGACKGGREFLDSCKDLLEAVILISEADRDWTIRHGYVQFLLSGPLHHLGCHRKHIRNMLKASRPFWPFLRWDTMSPGQWAVALTCVPGVCRYCTLETLIGVRDDMCRSIMGRRRYRRLLTRIAS